MSVARIAFLLVLFAAGFAGARWVLGASGSERSPSRTGVRGAPADMVTEPPVPSSSKGAPTGDGVELPGPRTIEVGVESLTEWQKLIIAEPERAPRTRGMVRGELYELIARDGNHPATCLVDVDGLVGAYNLLFETDLRSRGRRVETSAWRFVKVLDGTPIPDDVIACMEAMLAMPFTLEGPPGEDVFLPSYDGRLQVEIAALAAGSANAE